MIPRLKPTLGAAELLAAFGPGSGEDIGRFEAGFARLMGQAHGVAFPYGRIGLMLLLQALGLNGREIICPAYTCVVVQHAIVLSGNTPVFVDCEPDGWNMDLEQAAARVTPETGAIIPTSLFGTPVNLDCLDAFRRANPKVAVIQDCAHSFGCEWKGRPVQREGDATVYGLNISKLLTSVFGGMITTDDAALAGRLRDARRDRLNKPGLAKSFRRLAYLCAVYPAFFGPLYGVVNRLERAGALGGLTDYYDEGVIDMPADAMEGLTPLEARVGMANIRRYGRILDNRRQAAVYYAAALKNLPGIRVTEPAEGATCSHFSILMDGRDALLKRALARGVQLGCIPEYSVPEMAAYGAHPPEAYPRAGELARTVVNLPVWGGQPLAERVVRVIGDLFFQPKAVA